MGNTDDLDILDEFVDEEEDSQKNAKKFLDKVTITVQQENIDLSYVDISSIPEKLSNQIDVLLGSKNYLKHNKITHYQLKKLLQTQNILMDGYHKTSVAFCTEHCLIQERCPLAILERAPFQICEEDELEECPVETTIIEQKVEQYVFAIAEKQKLEIDEVKRNPFIMELIGEIAESYIIENRINTELALKGMLIDVVGAMSNTGEVAYNKTVHPLYHVKINIKKTREAKLKMLLLTPEMELKSKVKNADPSSKASDITKRAKVILEENSTDFFDKPATNLMKGDK